jgi:hypothetical protein
LLPEFRFIRTLQSPHHLVFNEHTGRWTISSQAFNPSSSDKKLSGDLEQILVADGLDAVAMYPAVRDAVGAASVTVEQIRDATASVEHDPEPSNWYHGSVTGTKAKKVKQRLRDVAVEIIPIDHARASALNLAVNERNASVSST